MGLLERAYHGGQEPVERLVDPRLELGDEVEVTRVGEGRIRNLRGLSSGRGDDNCRENDRGLVVVQFEDDPHDVVVRRDHFGAWFLHSRYTIAHSLTTLMPA